MTKIEFLGNYTLRQSDQCFKLGQDSVCLSAFATVKSGWRVCDLGCGIGTLLLLLAQRAPNLHLTGIELDPAAAQLAVQNISDNALTAQIICGDLRERTHIPSDSMQLVISNPPYFRQGSGKSGGSFRMDMTCSVEALCGTASRILRSGGRFAVVFRAERLADLICAMRNVNIEPKRLQFLAHPQKMPYGVLLEGVKHGGVGLDLLY